MITQRQDGLLLKIQVQPKSSKNQIVGLHGDRLKIKLTAPPVDGAANNLCIQFLAKQLGLAKSRLTITAGHTGRQKTIALSCPDPTEQKSLIKRIKTLYAP